MDDKLKDIWNFLKESVSNNNKNAIQNPSDREKLQIENRVYLRVMDFVRREARK